MQAYSITGITSKGETVTVDQIKSQPIYERSIALQALRKLEEVHGCTNCRIN